MPYAPEVRERAEALRREDNLTTPEIRQRLREEFGRAPGTTTVCEWLREAGLSHNAGRRYQKLDVPTLTREHWNDALRIARRRSRSLSRQLRRFGPLVAGEVERFAVEEIVRTSASWNPESYAWDTFCALSARNGARKAIRKLVGRPGSHRRRFYESVDRCLPDGTAIVDTVPA